MLSRWWRASILGAVLHPILYSINIHIQIYYVNLLTFVWVLWQMSVDIGVYRKYKYIYTYVYIFKIHLTFFYDESRPRETHEGDLTSSINFGRRHLPSSCHSCSQRSPGIGPVIWRRCSCWRRQRLFVGWPGRVGMRNRRTNDNGNDNNNNNNKNNNKNNKNNTNNNNNNNNNNECV